MVVYRLIILCMLLLASCQYTVCYDACTVYVDRGGQEIVPMQNPRALGVF